MKTRRFISLFFTCLYITKSLLRTIKLKQRIFLIWSFQTNINLLLNAVDKHFNFTKRSTKPRKVEAKIDQLTRTLFCFLGIWNNGCLFQFFWSTVHFYLKPLARLFFSRTGHRWQFRLRQALQPQRTDLLSCCKSIVLFDLHDRPGSIAFARECG